MWPDDPEWRAMMPFPLNNPKSIPRGDYLCAERQFSGCSNGELPGSGREAASVVIVRQRGERGKSLCSTLLGALSKPWERNTRASTDTRGFIQSFL